ACVAPMALSSFAAAGTNSIFHAMLQHALERDRPDAAGAMLFQTLLAEIDVFEIGEMLLDRLTGVVRLGTPGRFRELFQPFLDFRRQADGEHETTPLLYAYSVARVQLYCAVFRRPRPRGLLPAAIRPAYRPQAAAARTADKCRSLR